MPLDDGIDDISPTMIRPENKIRDKVTLGGWISVSAPRVDAWSELAMRSPLQSKVDSVANVQRWLRLLKNSAPCVIGSKL